MKINNFLTENEYEENLINELQQLGYKFKTPEEIFDLRNSNFSEVLLISEIEDFLKNKYKNISNDDLNKIISKIKNLKSSEKIKANIEFQKFIVEGIKIKNNKLKKTITYKIFDKKHNSFIVANQFKMTSSHPNYNNQKPDIVLYCNGLPIVVVELKKDSENNDTLVNAYKQMNNYELYLNDLFVYNAFNIISNPVNSKYGTLNSPFSNYKFWRGKNWQNKNLNLPSNLFKDLLKPKTLIDVITNYTFFIDNEKKIIAGYHQYYGVKNAIRNINVAMENKDNNFKKGGIFWHTQGSGKSFSMLFLARNLTKEKDRERTTFIIVTDRNDLDNQLCGTFEKGKNYIGAQEIYQVNSKKDLMAKLRDKNQNGIYFTTVQKFTDEIGELSSREDILIISDEAHRSHTNIEGKLVTKINDEKIISVDEKFGNAKYLRVAFPNATLIGFTGTPIEKEDASTSDVFGEVFTKYLMIDGENDGVIVPIEYEARKPELRIDEVLLIDLENGYKKIINEIREKSNIPDEMEKKANKALQKISNIISLPERINGVIEDFIKHYNSRKNILRGKAMFVALNRHIAFAYYKKLIEKDPSFEKITKLIITNSNGQQDEDELQRLAGTPKYRKDMADEFKKEDSNFKIAIVVDMWLTGFDVPSLDTIYLDKPLKMHNLMQAIARTNRVYSNKKEGLNKDSGLIVDYIGLFKRLNEALAYYSGQSSEVISSKRDLSVLKPHYLKLVNNWYKKYLEELYKQSNFKKLINDSKQIIQFVEKGTQNIIFNKKEQSFVRDTRNLNKYLKSIISILNDEEKIKFQLLLVIRSYLINIAFGEIEFISKEEEIKELLNKAIKYDETMIINKIKGNAISISEMIKYINSDINSNTKQLDIKLKIKAVKNLLSNSEKINIKKTKELRTMLDDLLNRYNKNYISMNELLNGLKDISNNLAEMHSNKKNKLGYTEEERAFYNILFDPLKNNNPYDENIIKKIMEELLEIINNNKNVNDKWIYNPSMKKAVRRELIRLLRKHNYPPKEIEITRDSVIEQIEKQKGYND